MLDQDRLDRRIAASKLADQALNLLWEEFESLPTPEERNAFWDAAWRRLTPMMPKPTAKPSEVIPFTAAEAREFGKTEIDFGKHQGSILSEAARVDPFYFVWYANQTFQEQLRRYLASDAIAEFIRNENGESDED